MKNSNGKRVRELLIRVLDSGLIQSHSKPIIRLIWEAYFLRRRFASVQ